MQSSRLVESNSSLAHAKGIMLTGTFTPTSAAKELSSAPHFSASSTPVTVRFSSSTGIPVIPDFDPNGDPRGFAVRFNLPEKNGRRVHTDIVSHSVPFFPTRTGAEFLEFLQALIATASSKDSPSPVEKFLGGHPAALAFVQAPKPTPKSFAQQQYWGINAFKFISSEGKETYVRYHVTPDAGVETYTAEEVKSKGENFLREELVARVKDSPISFTLSAQLAEEGDQTDDATVHWPESRKVVELGKITMDKVIESDKQKGEQKKIIFDPVPRVQGIESSADPLLEMRAGIYIISGKQRRAADS
jgi:catalase